MKQYKGNGGAPPSDAFPVQWLDNTYWYFKHTSGIWLKPEMLLDRPLTGWKLFQAAGEIKQTWKQVTKPGKSQAGEPREHVVGKVWGVRSERENGVGETDRCWEPGKGSLSVLRWVSLPLHLRRLRRKHGTEREALLNWRATNERRLDAGDEPRGSAVGSEANNRPRSARRVGLSHWWNACRSEGGAGQRHARKSPVCRGIPSEHTWTWHPVLEN